MILRSLKLLYIKRHHITKLKGKGEGPEGKCLRYMQWEKNQYLVYGKVPYINREKPKPSGRRGKGYEWDFVKEEIQMANKYF